MTIKMILQPLALAQFVVRLGLGTRGCECEVPLPSHLQGRSHHFHIPPQKGPQYVHAWANKKKNPKQLETASQGRIFLNSIEDVLNNPEMERIKLKIAGATWMDQIMIHLNDIIITWVRVCVITISQTE